EQPRQSFARRIEEMVREPMLRNDHRCYREQGTVWLENPVELARAQERIGDVLEHVERKDGVERGILEGQTLVDREHVGRGVRKDVFSYHVTVTGGAEACSTI